MSKARGKTTTNQFYPMDNGNVLHIQSNTKTGEVQTRELCYVRPARGCGKSFERLKRTLRMYFNR